MSRVLKNTIKYGKIEIIREVIVTEDIKAATASNIRRLRTEAGLTQLELAEKLCYSDKSISKWERAEALPDISVLKEMADLFGVSVDELIRDNEHRTVPTNTPTKTHNRKVITTISVLTVWLISTVIFVLACIVNKAPGNFWLAFVYAVPISAIVLTVFIAIWFNRRNLFPVISVLMWSTLAALFLQLIVVNINVWPVFLLGIPGQIIIILCSNFSFRQKKKG